MKDCGIVKDLLPLYAEDMASEESAAFVKQHLEECEDCRRVFEEMKAPVETEPAAPLKTVRKAVKKRGWLIAGMIACLVAALSVGAFARLTKPIVLSSTESAFAEVTVIPETIPLPASHPIHRDEPQREAAPETTPAPEKPFPTAMTEMETVAYVVVMIGENEALTLIPSDGGILTANIDAPGVSPAPKVEYHFEANPTDSEQKHDSVSLEGYLSMNPSGDADAGNDRKTAYVYSATEEADALIMDAEPEAVIVSTPRTLALTANPDVEAIKLDQSGRECSVYAYTTLWRQWFSGGETARTQIDLSGIDAVYFEPFNNTERVALYEREGYKGEAGFALTRLVMNYYFLMALAGTILLAVVWFVLRLLKKQKASRVFGVLLLIAASGVLAFLFAGFPATTIEPLRDLIFVCIIAALLFGAGLSARALLKKE